MSLWEWRKTIVNEGVEGKRKNGEIYVVDVTGKQKTTWKLINAWPCNYVVGALVPDSNEALLEEIHHRPRGTGTGQVGAQLMPQTESTSRCPSATWTSDGTLHREGTMRLATARDEIEPLRDARVRDNSAYLGVLQTRPRRSRAWAMPGR